MIKIISLNCRGLNNVLKRRLYFKLFNSYDIICLQETYITKDTINLWKKEWTGYFLAEAGTKNSQGLIILCRKSFNFQLINEIRIDKRCIGIQISVDEIIFTVFNIYIPSCKSERSPYFKNLLKEIPQHNKENSIILCGDFNCVLDNKRDIISGKPHAKKEVDIFNEFKTNLNLIDTWGEMHLQNREFTWSKFTPFIARRLDYIFVSQDLISNTHSARHIHFTSTDHKAVNIQIKPDDFVRGPSRWQFNTSLLEEEEFIDLMSKAIQMRQEKINTQEGDNLDKRGKWDLIKVGIREDSIKYSRNKAIRSKNSFDLEDEIKTLESDLALNPNNQEKVKELRNSLLKKEVEEMSKIRGAMKRAKTNWIENGEKNTKYFLGLEKRTQSNNIIKAIKTTDGELTKNPEKVLNNLKLFYKSLYEEKGTDNNEAHKEKFIEGLNIPKLSKEQVNVCDKDITIDELHTALLQLNEESSPGTDGITPSFYITFWHVLQKPFLECILESIEKGELSISQRRGIITLLHKGKELPKHDPNSYRPITVTNCDYKILSKLLAMRLQGVLKSIIHENQAGFIKGRSISSQIRLIDDIIKYANDEKIEGLIVSLDFFKAFDSLSKNLIIFALDCFNFGDAFKQYISTLIGNSESAIKNGGWISGWFKTEKGVRQGCCASPLLFILTLELLAIKLRENDQVRSILIDKTETHKDSKNVSFADDMTLCLKDRNSLRIALDIIDDFSLISSLYLNRKKCNALCVGGLEIGNQGAHEGINLVGKGGKVKILGVYFSAAQEASLIADNWENIIAAMKDAIAKWSRRDLSLYGKIIVAKTFLLSKLSYILQSLSIPQAILSEIDTLIFKFLWKKKQTNTKAYEKVKRKILCLETKKGGLNMIRVQDQQTVFLIKWIEKRLAVQHTRNCGFFLMEHFFSKLGGIKYTSTANVSSREFQGLDLIPSQFWKNSLTVYLDTKKKIINDQKMLTPNDGIFNNTFIRFKEKTLFIQRWIERGLSKIRHIISDSGKIKPIEEIKLIVGNYGGLLFDYYAVFNGIKNSTLTLNTNSTGLTTERQSIITTPNNKTLRQILLETDSIRICGKEFWLRKYNIDITPYFELAVEATKETRLRLLHFKILHNIYPTNILLNKMKIKDTDKCEKCGERDVVEHTFFKCKGLSEFWKDVASTIEKKTQIKIVPTETLALFGVIKTDMNVNKKVLNTINHIILIAKMCISKAKYGKVKHVQTNFDRELELREKYL